MLLTPELYVDVHKINCLSFEKDTNTITMVFMGDTKIAASYNTKELFLQIRNLLFKELKIHG
jgi:hypothetical protein